MAASPENCVYECIVFDMHQLMKTNAFCRPLMTDIESRQVDIFPCFSVHAHEMRSVVEHLFRAAAQAGGGMGAHHAGDAFSPFLGRLTSWALTGCTTRRRTGSPGTC